MYAAIEQHEQLPKIDYFSFAVRIKNDVAGYIMVDHKLKIKLIDGQPRFGLCLLACSVWDKPGHLQAHYTNKDIDEYAPKEKRWQKMKVKSLTAQEKTVLAIAKQGKTHKEIAKRLKVKPQTVLNIQSSIYRKLNVNSIVQAITHATHRHLIFVPALNNRMKPDKKQVVKKQRRAMTSEKLQRIQEKLNRGESVNSIAKQVNIGEWTIRYAIEVTKKLKKKHSAFEN